MLVHIIQIVRLLIILASRHRSLVFENMALRQQLAVCHRTRPKPTVRSSDRLFWVGLRLAWPDWKSALVIVHSHRLASPRLRVVLDPTVASEGRPTAGRRRCARPDSHVGIEPDQRRPVVGFDRGPASPKETNRLICDKGAPAC